MYILTNISVKDDRARIFDTQDSSMDTVNLTMLAKKIRGKKCKVYGLKYQTNKQSNDLIVLNESGVVIDQREAKEALAYFYMQNGMDKRSAYQKVGLSPS